MLLCQLYHLFDVPDLWGDTKQCLKLAWTIQPEWGLQTPFPTSIPKAPHLWKDGIDKGGGVHINKALSHAQCELPISAHSLLCFKDHVEPYQWSTKGKTNSH